MYGTQGDKILAAFDRAGFVGLCLYESGARSMYAKKPTWPSIVPTAACAAKA